MPIYEYKCRACEHKFDKLQKLNDPPFTVCPDCGEPALVKLVSAAGFRLKGTGWYETDFKTSGKKPTSTSNSDNSAKKTANKPSSANESSSSS